MSTARDIPPRAKQILAKPGFVTGADAIELRESLGDATEVILHNLDRFGLACLAGDLGAALMLLTAQDDQPDLSWKQQPLGHTYATLVVLGYQTGCASLEDDQTNGYIRLLDALLSAGVPVDSPDIVGMTALHHAAKWAGTGGLIKVLLKHKANEHVVDVIPKLLDGGADLDVTDGEGSSPRSMYPTRPAEVSSVVKNWLVQHEGKGAILRGDRCSRCGTRSSSVKRCARCRSQLYCSPECQRADWKEHKKSCQPFDKEDNLLVVTPTYTHGTSNHVHTISVVPSSFGSSRGPNPSGRFEANVRDGRNMVLKIQVPLGNGGLFLYNKKRTFECILNHDKNPVAFMRIKKIINEKGILGLKGYFAAELRSKDELAINVAECLPESRF